MSDSNPRRVKQSVSSPAKAGKASVSKPRKRTSGDVKELSPRNIMQAFEGNIEPVTPTLMYRLCALLVSFVMILLPVIYIAMIGGVIWGVYFHAVHSLGLFEAGSSSTSTHNRGKGMVLLLLVYLTPIVVGVILIIFMLKPLFSRPSHSSAFRALKREKEPLLFMFVDQVCDAVGAPRPVQINLDIQVNASAGFRRGWLSMLGNDLVLTIGMPLVAGLSIRQFSGVLAHEFGHFSQGAGMRLSFIIRSINIWFMRVVYERDAWDERLEYLSQSIDIRLGWILHLARLFVWITRKILWLLMMTGHLVSGFLMRQMEFDADRYEARLAGSRCFAATSKRLALLGVANQGALSDLGQFYAEGRLVDNLPALININLSKMPAEVKQAVTLHIKEEQTGWFDTHPATLERIANIQNEDPEGIFRLKSPATILFTDFSREAKFVTRDFYYGVFGKKIPREDLHSVDELMVRQEAENESHKAVQRFYQGAIYPNRPLLFSESAVKTPADAKQCAQELKSNREKLLKYREKYKSFVDEYREYESKSMSVAMAEVAVRARLKLKVDDPFFKSLTNYDKVMNAKHGLERKKSGTRVELEKYESLIVNRLERALQLFHVPKVQTQIADAALWERDLHDLLQALQATNSQLSRLWELHMNAVALQVLLRFFDELRTDDKYCEVVLSEMEKMETLLNSIYARFQRLLYPFEHSRVDITIAEFALVRIPESNNPGELLGAAEELFENLMALNHRVLGRLCLLAEEVETLLGFEVLPEFEEAIPDELES
ncbi:M48 family metallopeptidase [Gimesia algae]|uniref:Heat shock protein HtpX n=1 Tax=Gimesia algae TaxID=2527971 RepID=A0A517VBR1_9PLAN|nr:M48 family metallopeptidase [Gimesia algae]QDT90441.1 heat shock protein HtpX [Gimesia algae]